MTTTERMNIQLSEIADTLLKRIVESRFGEGSGSSMFLNDSTVEHLIHEEARRLKVTDCSQSEDCSHPQGSVLEDQDLEAKK